jgi:hypothetical protein
MHPPQTLELSGEAGQLQQKQQFPRIFCIFDRIPSRFFRRAEESLFILIGTTPAAITEPTGHSSVASTFQPTTNPLLLF